jgi:hypothetical protein
MPEKHNCRWVGCTKKVPLNMWGCKTHWFMLPKAIRDKIWASYRPGQEDDLQPSAGWVAADDEARRYSANPPSARQL